MSTREYSTRIAGAASIMGSLTLVSRLLGYVRDAFIAYLFGAGLQADAFFVAFRVSNLLRRLLGEGALTSSFVPVFTDVLNTRSKEDARRVASSVFFLFLILLLLLTAGGIIFSEEIVWLMSPGFSSIPEKFPLTVNLTRLMFPYMIFIGLMAIVMGVLNSMGHFTAPALSPVFFNISIILSMFFLVPFMDEPVYALAWGVLLGGVVQFAIQVPVLKRYGMGLSPSLVWRDPAIRRIFVLLGPAVVGVGVYQLNIFVIMRFASDLADGSVSYLYYASRLMELPLGVFGVAVSTAVLPSLSECVANRDWTGFRESLSFAMRMVNLVTIPATIGLVVLGLPVVDILFGRGEFTMSATLNTAYALYFYAVGLVPVAVSRILVSVYYSLRDTITPVWTAFLSFLFNILMCLVLVGPLGHGGLALATSLSSLLNALLLFVILRARVGGVDGRRVLTSAWRSTMASVAMGAIVYGVTLLVDWHTMAVLPKTAFTLACVGMGVVVYVALCGLFRVEELPFLKNLLKKG